MRDNSRLLIGIIIGAVAGVAIAVFANSEKGQELIDEIQDAAAKAEKDIKKAVERFEEKLSKGKDLAETYEKKGRKFIKHLR